MSSKIKKKGRTLSFTVKELMESERLKLAIQFFDKDPLLMKAILTELALESLMVGKNTIIRRVNASSLDKFELIPWLRSLDLDEYNTFNIYWGLTDVERQLYLAKVNGATKEEMDAIVDKVNSRLGVTKLINEKYEKE